MDGKHGLLICFLSCILITGCGEKKDPDLVEAARIHNEMIAGAERLEIQLDSLTKSLHTLEAKISPADSLKKRQVVENLAGCDLVKKNIAGWEEDMVEVPGNEHHHHHNGEEHEHKPAPDLTPKQMLEVQKAKKAELEPILKTGEKLISEATVHIKK